MSGNFPINYKSPCDKVKFILQGYNELWLYCDYKPSFEFSPNNYAHDENNDDHDGDNDDIVGTW